MKATWFRLINSLCVFFLFHSSTFAQVSSDPYVVYDTSFRVKGYFNQLQFAPLKLIGSINPGIELSYERMDKSRWSTQVTGTYLLPRPLLNINGTKVDPDKKGFKIAVEEKFYVYKMESKGFYVAGALAYMHSRNVAEMNFESLVLNRSYKDTFEITKNNLYFTLQCGYYFTFKRIMVTFAGGFGAQHRNAAHAGRINADDQFTATPIFIYLPHFYNKAGRSWEGYFPLTMRIGYLF